MQILKADSFPLLGKRLIEASAGTGKTYTINQLYRRAVLGHRINQKLDCTQILVVTFTTAATAELRERIRKRLAELMHLDENEAVELTDSATVAVVSANGMTAF